MRALLRAILPPRGRSLRSLRGSATTRSATASVVVAGAVAAALHAFLTRLLRFDVDGALGKSRQQLVRLALFVQRFLQQVRLLFLSELPRVRPHGPVASNL